MSERDLPFFVSGCTERDMGQLAEILQEPRWEFSPRWSESATAVFSPDRHAGLIILGDGEDWATSVRYHRERMWLASALGSATPVLGICYGAQLLAAYLDKKSNGKPLAKTRTKEHIGIITEITIAVAGGTDPVVRHLACGALVTQYHEDAFQLPSGATALAWSNDHSYQHCEAFRVGEPEAAVYGLQFHPEPTLQMLQNDQWFTPLPTLTQLQSVVKAGERSLRAWVELTDSCRIGRNRAAD